MDKYGVGQDAYCYPGTTVLRNRLNILDDDELFQAERDFSELAASQIEFQLPPYDLAYLQGVHRTLFMDVYAWPVTFACLAFQRVALASARSSE